MKRVVIVGGGIAGLSIGHALVRSAPAGIDIRILEKNERPGGNIRTDRISGYICEWGPNGFLDGVPETLELVRDLGIEGEIQVSDEASRRRFIFRRGRLHPVPDGIWAFLSSRLLSLRGKLAIATEPLARRRPDGDESVHGFAARRIGREAADVLIDSMVSGIFAGDAKTLSMRACFPKMWQMENDHGGLLRAMLASRFKKRRGDGAGARRTLGSPAGTLTSFRDGTESLVLALTRALGGIVRTGVRVAALNEAPPEPVSAAPHGELEIPRYRLSLAGGETIDADAIVLSAPSSESARLLTPLDPDIADELRAISAASIVVVALGYDASSIPRPLRGFGFLVPRGEGPRILGCLWDSSVYPGRAPQGKVLMRAMIGGARDLGAIDLSDETLLDTVMQDLAATMDLDLDPEFVEIFRHPVGIPQYTVGHPERLRRIDALLRRHPGIVLAGNSYRGISMNACIADARPAAERVLAHLGAIKGSLRSVLS